MPNKLQRFYTSNESLTGDTTSPFTYFEWLERQTYSTGVDRNDAFAHYNEYLKVWFNAKNVQTDKQQSVYVRALYVEMLKQVAVEYTTPEEKKFLKNIDYNNDEDLDIAIPFFAKKLKEVTLYISKKRDEVKFSKVKASIGGSKAGTEQTIYSYIADIVQTDTDILSQLDDLGLNPTDILTHLKIDVNELYDTEQTYFDIDPTASSSDYATAESSRSTYFTSNILPLSGDLFIDDLFTAAVTDVISQVPVLLTSEDNTLQDVTNISLSITDDISGTEIDRLDSTNFIDYTNNEDSLNLYNTRDIQRKYAGTDYFYLSTGATTGDTVSGELFTADSPHRNLLNKFYPTIASVQGEDLYKLEFVGGFFKNDKIGMLNYTSFNSSFEYVELSASSVYYFPDPESGARGSGLGQVPFYSPIRYLDNCHWLKKDISNQYSCGEPRQYSNILSFYPYQSKHNNTESVPDGVSRHTDNFNFWESNTDNIWTNADVYPISGETPIDSRQEKLLTGIKNVHKWRTDIYGNNYALVKTNIKPEPSTISTSVPYLSGSQYITTDTAAKSEVANSITDTVHNKKLLHEASNTVGTLYFRNLNSDTIGTMQTSLSGVYSKYSIPGNVTFAGKEYSLAAIKTELLEGIIDFDIIYDVLIIKTNNYIVIEKLEYDYDENTITSTPGRRIFLPRVITGNKFEKFGNWWFDENSNRILLTRSTVSSTLSGTNHKMIYPEIYHYDIASLNFKQVYPDPDMSSAELDVETSQYCLSSVPSRYNIQETSTPVLTYNKESERYTLSYISNDNTQNLFYNITSFRLLDEIVEFIDVEFYKNNYTIFEENFYGTDIVTDNFSQFAVEESVGMSMVNPIQAGTHIPESGVLYMGATIDDSVVIPYEWSTAAWEYGKSNENFDGERDIVITFEYAMFSTTNQKSYALSTGGHDNANPPGEGISIILFDAVKNENLKLYSGHSGNASKISANNTTFQGGGVGTAFGYLSSNAEYPWSYNDGLAGGHVCVALDIRGEFADTSSPNAITVRGPCLSGEAVQISTTTLTDSLHQGTIDNLDNVIFTKCRVTLTDLGRRIIVETAPIGTTNFTEHVNTRMEDHWPVDYILPSKLKSAVAFNTSDHVSNCVFRSLEITGAGSHSLANMSSYSS